MLGSVLPALLLAAVADTPACEQCHARQAQQWRRSLHAASTTDSLYLAMREWARSDGGEAAAAPCVTCHSTAIAGGGRSAAVGCRACHQSRRRSDRPGALIIHPEAPVTSSGRVSDAPHELVHDPALASGAACLACHGELHNPAGVPLCTTGPEATAGGGPPACPTCHMPGGDHSFPGASPALLAAAAAVEIEPHDGTVVIRVSNVGAGHALPTGPVLRQVRLEVSFLAASGRLVWDNRVDTTSVLARTLHDAGGRRPAPPWRAAGVAQDTRLAPGETWTFRYAAPPSAATVKARLVYHRAPPPLLARLGLAEDPDLAPVEMLCFEADLRAPPPP